MYSDKIEKKLNKTYFDQVASYMQKYHNCTFLWHIKNLKSEAHHSYREILIFSRELIERAPMQVEACKS